MAGDSVQPQEHSGNRTAAGNPLRSTQNGRLSPAMNIDTFKPAIVYTIYIASTPEKVWQALTTAEFSRQYFSGFAIEAELKIGGAFIARAPDGSVPISAELFELDHPRHIAFTWAADW